MCVSKRKTDKENQNQPAKKNWKAKKSKQKKKNVQKVYLKTSCKKSLGRLKESRKILFDVKAVLLMVPWVRVDSYLFISLLSIYDFHDDTAFLKINVQLKAKRKGSSRLP
jgi:hypothetical protein